MIVSWNWLKEYLTLDMPPAEFERRLMMAGLNHESTTPVGDDLAIDLEVTSNRPDCLGHLGIAREAAVLFDRELKLPQAAPKEGATRVTDLTKVTVQCPQLCYRYTARVIRGVKIAASPAWLAKRLTTIGIAAINNVVDITNYVLMECGQPLHAFDFNKLAGREIIVRDARPGEKFLAIDHKTYDLAPGICVIADRDKAVGLGGVMGGADSEVSPATTDLLIESAEFDPASIRSTARRLSLHSDSSYRFERGLDPEGVDWASRRTCELILELAGGELAAGVIDVGRQLAKREPITLRLSQLKRILGIEVPGDRVQQILKALGNVQQQATASGVQVIPPSWRRDLSREIDLVEEVARIYGYEKIPEDVSVPMATSARGDDDRVLDKVRRGLTAVGFDEALTVSVVEEEWSEAFSPWTNAAPLVSLTPLLRRNDRLRRSLVPSLLGARRTNETLANEHIELFEIAKVYLPQQGKLPVEELMLGLTSGGEFFDLKGVIEAIVAQINPQAGLEIAECQFELLAAGKQVELRLGGETLGYLGEVSDAGRAKFELRGRSTVAELKLAVLMKAAVLVPRYAPLPVFPAITRDLNLVVDEAVRWADLAKLVHSEGGPHLEALQYQDTYRDAERLGAGKKSQLFTITLRDPQSTLTSQQADAIRDRIIAACHTSLGAELRA
jgi:phenylalanyl-tRNA synthetase beta chain